MNRTPSPHPSSPMGERVPAGPMRGMLRGSSFPCANTSLWRLPMNRSAGLRHGVGRRSWNEPCRRPAFKCFGSGTSTAQKLPGVRSPRRRSGVRIEARGTSSPKRLTTRLVNRDVGRASPLPPSAELTERPRPRGRVSWAGETPALPWRGRVSWVHGAISTQGILSLVLSSIPLRRGSARLSLRRAALYCC